MDQNESVGAIPLETFTRLFEESGYNDIRRREREALAEKEMLECHESVYGKNPDFPTLLSDPLPHGVAVRVASAVVWDGGMFRGLTLVRGTRPSDDAAIVNSPHTLGNADRTQKLYNQSGLDPKMVAVFFHLWDLPPIEWTFFDVPSPVTERE